MRESGMSNRPSTPIWISTSILCNLRKDPVKTGQRTSREVKIGMAWQETSHMYCCCGIFDSNALTSLD